MPKIDFTRATHDWKADKLLTVAEDDIARGGYVIGYGDGLEMHFDPGQSFQILKEIAKYSGVYLRDQEVINNLREALGFYKQAQKDKDEVGTRRDALAWLLEEVERVCAKESEEDDE